TRASPPSCRKRACISGSSSAPRYTTRVAVIGARPSIPASITASSKRSSRNAASACGAPTTSRIAIPQLRSHRSSTSRVERLSSATSTRTPANAAGGGLAAAGARIASRAVIDRVADEVHHHLTQPDGVTCHLVGNIGRDVADEIEALAVRANRQRAKAVAHDLAQGERLVGQLELSCFDLREVEKIVDDDEEVI